MTMLQLLVSTAMMLMAITNVAADELSAPGLCAHCAPCFSFLPWPGARAVGGSSDPLSVGCYKPLAAHTHTHAHTYTRTHRGRACSLYLSKRESVPLQPRRFSLACSSAVCQCTQSCTIRPNGAVRTVSCALTAQPRLCRCRGGWWPDRSEGAGSPSGDSAGPVPVPEMDRTLADKPESAPSAATTCNDVSDSMLHGLGKWCNLLCRTHTRLV